MLPIKYLLSVLMSASDAFERLIAGRWIAGEGIDDALEVAEALNQKGITAMINYLGEDFKDEKKIDDAIGTYLKLMKKAKEKGARISIAVKLTQLGLCISKETARKNYSRIVAAARGSGIFVWLDMEEYRYIQDTISIYETEAKRGGAGICIQSYPRRSMNDAKRIVKEKGIVRLVKGAYSAGKDIAYPTRAEATDNYGRIIDYLFKNSRSFMLATHDEKMISKALTLQKKSKADVSFAMLKGIRNRRAIGLAGEGQKVSVYVPFGSEWLSYTYRRMREFSNMKLVLRSLLEPEEPSNSK